MSPDELFQITSETLTDFKQIMQPQTVLERNEERSPKKIELNQEEVKNGLGQLVLTLVKLIHELLEKQAIKRIDSGTLTDTEIERIGMTLMKQAEEIDRLREEFHLDEEDLNIDLGPLGRLL